MQIEEYDSDSGQLLRCLTVPGLRAGRDIVACEHNRCAYISDNKCIHRVALPDAADITRWPVADCLGAGSLSLTVTHNVSLA